MRLLVAVVIRSDRYCQQVAAELKCGGGDFPISAYCDVLRRMGDGK